MISSDILRYHLGGGNLFEELELETHNLNKASTLIGFCGDLGTGVSLNYPI